MIDRKGPFDIVVVGGGPGGYVAAIRAAQLGATVALIEKDRVGGTCLNIGCIPTKALITSAELYREALRGQVFGVDVEQVKPNLARMMERKQAVVEALVSGVAGLLEANSVALFEGTAGLLRPGVVEVVNESGKSVVVEAKRLIIATGSVPAQPPVEGRELPGVLTSTEALELDHIPETLVIVGGGVIGLEFAGLFNALGTRVTVLEMLPRLLAGACDEELARRLLPVLRRQGIEVRTNARVVKFAQGEGGGAEVTFEGADGQGKARGELALVATGRWPYTDGLGIDEAGIKRDGRAIKVDEYLQTNVTGVYAIGDVIGGYMLAHVASVEGRVAAENALGYERRVDYRSVPQVVFTNPEVASVGLTEAQAREKGYQIKTSKFPFSANPRARTLEQSQGIVKVVCEEQSGRLLGMHILGTRASDLIAEGALAVQVGATAEDLAWTTHAHPTLPEGVLEAALGVVGQSIHYHKVRP